MTSKKKSTEYQSLIRKYYRQRRIIAILVLFVAILGGRLLSSYLGTGQNVPAVGDYERYNDRTFECIKVVDGDTIDINITDLKAREYQPYTRIRLWGIDTPEIGHHGTNDAYYGHQASQFARTKMQGRQVKLKMVPRDTRGYYGRLLAYVFLPNGKMYNRLAVKKGYAYADHRFDHPLKEQFLALEAQARENRAGLWKQVEPDQLPKWYNSSKLSDFWNLRDPETSENATKN